jgi:CheY-like chemotaxis protein
LDAKWHEAQQPALLNGIRVFIVEDEPDTREFLERFLRAYGADVVAVSTATEALAILPRCEADILVSDIGLPGMDGYDLIQQVRRMEVKHCGTIPAIALTAYARTEDRTRAFRAGYQAHLAKPVEPAELIATIASFAELIDGPRRNR